MLVLVVAFGALIGTAAATASAPTTVVVQANVRTTDTGVSITAGTAAIVTASGHWDTCNGGCPSGPDGATNGNIGYCPGVYGRPAAELVGSLDGGSTFFDVGSGPTVIAGSPVVVFGSGRVIAGTGELLLGGNDCANYSDNTGYLTATIVLFPTSKDACKLDGWRNLQRRDGTSFENQGNCVSYVSTGK